MRPAVVGLAALLLVTCGKQERKPIAQPTCDEARGAALVAWRAYEAEVQGAYDKAKADIPPASTIQSPDDMRRAQARIQVAADLRLKLNPVEEALLTAGKGQLVRELVNAVAIDSSDRYRAAMEASEVGFHACASE